MSWVVGRWSGTGCARKPSWLNAMPPARRKPPVAPASRQPAAPHRAGREGGTTVQNASPVLRFTRRKKSRLAGAPIPDVERRRRRLEAPRAPLPGATHGSDWPMHCCPAGAMPLARPLPWPRPTRSRMAWARVALSQVEDLAARPGSRCPARTRRLTPVSGCKPSGWPGAVGVTAAVAQSAPVLPAAALRRANSTCSPSLPTGSPPGGSGTASLSARSSSVHISHILARLWVRSRSGDRRAPARAPRSARPRSVCTGSPLPMRGRQMTTAGAAGACARVAAVVGKLRTCSRTPRKTPARSDRVASFDFLFTTITTAILTG